MAEERNAFPLFVFPLRLSQGLVRRCEERFPFFVSGRQRRHGPRTAHPPFVQLNGHGYKSTCGTMWVVAIMCQNERKEEMEKYTFTKGELELVNKRLTGWVIASTDFQHQVPSRLDIDTSAERVGPLTITEVGQFRAALTWLILFPVLSFVLGGGVALTCTLMLGSYLVGILGAVVAIIVAAKISSVLGRKWFSVFMVQFNNNGQTLYVPYIKKTDYPVIDALNSELKKYR